MKNNLFILFLILCPVVFGQDTVRLANQAKVANIVNRFNQITSSDIHCGDSLVSLMTKVQELLIINNTLKDQNKMISDTLQKFKQSLSLSDKNFIVEKYGKTDSETDYSIEQYEDFRNNYFLKNYLSKKEGVLVFFPYNKSIANLKMYREIDSLVNLYFNQKGLTFRIKAYSDSRGLEEINSELSKERAAFIRNYLIQEKKVNPRDITYEGKGAKSEDRFTEPELDFMNRRAIIILN